MYAYRYTLLRNGRWRCEGKYRVATADSKQEARRQMDGEFYDQDDARDDAALEHQRHFIRSVLNAAARSLAGQDGYPSIHHEARCLLLALADGHMSKEAWDEFWQEVMQ